MATVAPAGGATTETNIYDANGDRLVRRDSTGTTLYLPGQEIRRASSGTTTGTRYYTLAGTTCASRTPSGVTWLYDDHQGTQQIAVDAATQAVSVRRQTPYGGARGSNPAWPTQKGFVGGDNDPTGLVNIGARQYDPGLGRFISVDPVMDLSDPQQWNAYAYAGNTPVTNADPTGLRDECGGGTGNYSCVNSNGSVSSNTELTGEAKQQYDKVLDQIRKQNKCKASWWCRHKSKVVGIAVGVGVGVGCGFAIGWTGVGGLACGAAAGAASSFVTGWMDGKRGWDLAATTAVGAGIGFATAGVFGVAGRAAYGAGVAFTSGMGLRAAGQMALAGARTTFAKTVATDVGERTAADIGRLGQELVRQTRRYASKGLGRVRTLSGAPLVFDRIVLVIDLNSTTPTKCRALQFMNLIRLHTEVRGRIFTGIPSIKV